MTKRGRELEGDAADDGNPTSGRADAEQPHADSTISSAAAHRATGTTRESKRGKIEPLQIEAWYAAIKMASSGEHTSSIPHLIVEYFLGCPFQYCDASNSNETWFRLCKHSVD